MLLADPASAALGIDDEVAVFAVDLLLGNEVVVLVVDLQVGITAVADDGIHDVAADAVGNHIDIVGILDILAHHDDIGDMVVIPVAVAVEPEAGPVPRTGNQGFPEDGVAVDHIAVPGVIEVGSGMDGTAAGRQGAGMTRAGIASATSTGISTGTHIACRSAAGTSTTNMCTRTCSRSISTAYTTTGGGRTSGRSTGICTYTTT